MEDLDGRRRSGWCVRALEFVTWRWHFLPCMLCHSDLGCWCICPISNLCLIKSRAEQLCICLCLTLLPAGELEPEGVVGSCTEARWEGWPRGDRPVAASRVLSCRHVHHGLVGLACSR